MNNYKKILTLFTWLSFALLIVRILISLTDIIEQFNNLNFLILIYILLGYGGEAIFVSGIILFLYNNWLWKVFNFWKVPVFAKRYIGTMYSSYDGKERKAELIVVQSFLSIKIQMKTNESVSISNCECLNCENGTNILTYIYLNKPDLKLYERSKMHYGTAILRCDNVNQLSGDYYTDRKTIGSLKFQAVKKAKTKV